MNDRNQNWDDLGQSIQNAVDRAVNSQDYQKLNQTIRQVVGRVVNVGNQAADSIRNSGFLQMGTDLLNQRKLYGSTLGKMFAGILQIAVGFPVATTSGLLALAGTVDGEPIRYLTGLVIFFLACCAGGVALTINGIRNWRMISRFKVYRRALGSRTHCSVERLAQCVGKSERYVQKDLWRMIRAGLFREGHLDREQATLITSNETYRYYEDSRRQLERSKQQEEAKKLENPSSVRDPRVQEVLDRGDRFIAQIRSCNDAIPDREMSDKIARTEEIVQRIFDRAEADPDTIPELKKLMDYYLPMTVKLLNAYADMDAQTVQGENIQNSKREIEAALDTLNLAYEKILDTMYEDTALDVSSDISVLNTMLAQEGLTEDELTKMRKQKNL